MLGLLKIISDADLYAHQPFDLNITSMIFEAYGNARLKMAHSNKIRKAMSDTLLLGAGMNILYFKNSFSLANIAQDAIVNNSDAVYFNLSRPNGLIGGVWTARQNN